ncbi:MTH1187 family thiamine-binding protein [Halomonas sp. MCCC 1A17488]|uniref:MTH1187 family thiamine-binding protein n=1 Tax=Billgrantia sulfidoxydans TaxID=2733484 RepID=A0ABX7W5N4_9GAMM|nr:MULTISPECIES: MTH1187 family thiamine-binding protein [Halomonas]MCE8015370.1 MTH1187 family thiamine-binding protein [Halomonas sp. MCCC 1A17488]MCG3238703.1 MTH1187 family thiamine-binding protein [Halomonas sp. MCCC 1A17488]QPP51326.1 MTH1187 family thiamine-binding protein [Halomonas sp. SS10-MC5]QTP54882.1 MTH1187 family thiamine-binding protein [Halomonas sulfidoxydans]
MRVVADVNVTPIGAGASLSSHVAACEEVIEEAGLKYRLHAHGTNLEGSWEDVMRVVQRCHEVLHERGAPRVDSAIRIATATDKDQSLEGRIEKVERKIG